MIMNKFFSISILMLGLFFCLTAHGQSSYKGITIDRNKRDVTCIDVENSNAYPCQIRIQYKTGSKEAPWQDFHVKDLIPANASRYTLGSVYSKIYGLRITYVDIIQPSALEKTLKFIETISTGAQQQKTQ